MTCIACLGKNQRQPTFWINQKTSEGFFSVSKWLFQKTTTPTEQQQADAAPDDKKMLS